MNLPSENCDQYELSDDDEVIIASAIELLEKIMRAPFMRPAETVSVAKLLHVLRRLPGAGTEVEVAVTLNGPRRWFGEHEIWHWWEVRVEGGEIAISSGGHFYRESTGGDSFTSLTWTAQPGEPTECRDYFDDMGIVDDAQPFPDEVAALDLSEPGYSLQVSDADNPLLDEVAGFDPSG